VINLEVPRKFGFVVGQARQVAQEVFRPISRTYDREEHTRPKELDMLAAAIEGLEEAGTLGGAGASGVRRDGEAKTPRGDDGNRNGGNLSTALSIMELCWGDVGLLLSMPRQGLGNAAIASVADEQQAARYAGKWAAMAITEPEAGSDSAAIRTTAVLDGDHYVLNGTKIFVTAGDRADLLVVWATLDPARGRAAIKSFVVHRDNPGLQLVRVEDKLGIRASDTAEFVLQDCRVPKEDLLGSPEIDTERGFGGAM
jgi:acyl-CoA dehydrogenase